MEDFFWQPIDFMLNRILMSRKPFVKSHNVTLFTYPIMFQATRLGKHINELRKRTSDKQIGSRAKSLIKKWRNTFVQNPTGPAASQPPPQSVNNHVQNAQHQNASSKSNGQEPPPGGGNGLLRHKQGKLGSSPSQPFLLPSQLPWM